MSLQIPKLSLKKIMRNFLYVQALTASPTSYFGEFFKVKRKVDEKTNATNADESTNREDQQKEIRKSTSEQSNYDPQGEHSKEA